LGELLMREKGLKSVTFSELSILGTRVIYD
jgi:hypothetical protein